MLKKFLKAFTPHPDCETATPKLLDEYKEKVPESLLALWKNHGFGKYQNGLIELVNPKEFEPTLWKWLGREIDNYVPIAITAFGELFYYRKLTENDEDVCAVDIQFRGIEVLTWDLTVFFEEFLLDEEIREEWLRESLFETAMELESPLNRNEIFTFAPVFALGGAPEIEYIKRGNAQVYQELVFELTK